MQHRVFTRADAITEALALPAPRSGTMNTALLGTRCTAPLEDASVPTLASIIDLFDDRFALGLRDLEKAELVAFVEAADRAEEFLDGL